MDKAEELKQKAKIPKDTLLALLSVISKGETAIDIERDKKYRFTEPELDEYVQQVSREVADYFMQKGFDEATYRDKINPEDWKSFDDYWNEWKY